MSLAPHRGAPSTAIRWILLPAILIAVGAGCSTHRAVGLPPVRTISGPVAGDAGDVVKVHASVRVVLRSGEVLRGEVLAATPDALTIGRASNYGYQRVQISASDIAVIEQEGIPGPVGFLLGTVGVLSIAFVALLVTMAASWGPLN